ncbi:tyrosine-type recombinase/integrase [Limimaricola sp. G21655-S1]|uniref:site-specific integrase n=1 Tax=Limimaricola sp. G21655-S1 TaxID=3014768 RepID=UPI0022AF97EA|nr:site-specific integrase [Limimaricola sp. G21655-S1]MCZ4262868.1 tyrosine-type recombinase/integrase [Limimaricola sp. G21655-S1]
MKHETFGFGDIAIEQGDTADLRRCLWLSNMKGSTRNATLMSLATFCSASNDDGELSVVRVRQLIAAPEVQLKAEVGSRWTQVVSDVRRALRYWNDLPTRWLALRLRARIPTLTDAATAASFRLGADEAKRASAALNALAASEGGTLDDVPATAGVIEPLLRGATPETFGVASLKSLDNKRTLIRKVVRFVDPLSTGMRETSIDTLPAQWREILAILERQLKDHEKSAAAILRRLAGFCARQGMRPTEIDEPLVEAFVAMELATHAPTYVEKLRAALRRWNDAVDVGLVCPYLPLPAAPVHRQESVTWQSVPSSIRAPVDAYLETAVSVRNPGDWGDLVPDADPEYAELGIVFGDPVSNSETSAAPILEPGTHKNWRDAVKRAWHAAKADPRVQPKPEVLGELFCKPVVAALVASTRRARRQRDEAKGLVFDPKVKGRYEHTLVEALCSVGRALAVAPARLEEVEELKRQLDPGVIGMKRSADGSFKRVYAERRIGTRHANMLAQFADTTRLKRWFEGPSVLWTLACAPITRGRKPQASHVALARSALMARIGQYVAPVRRTNHARYRYEGDDRHIILPEGDGEGTLIIPAHEGKTGKEIHVRIDRETVRMLKYYIKHFLPVAQRQAKASPDNPHLFPGADGQKIEDGGYALGRGYITKSKLNTSFKKHMMKHCGLDLCLHVMRHLAGKIILDQDPSAMSLVKEILGHKRLRTTQSYYAEVCKIVAQRRYIHLLERQARQVLATMSFKFVDPQTGKEI